MKRKIIKSTIEVLMAAMIFASYPVFPAAASTSTEKISRVKLNLNLSKAPDVGDTIESDVTSYVTSQESSLYTVTKAEYTNDADNDEWQYGQYPVIEATVEIKDDTKYEFKSGVKADVTSTVKVDNVSVHDRDDDQVTVRIRLKKLRGDIDAPDDLYWSDKYTAAWDSIEGAVNYKVKLYREGSSVTEVTTTSTRYNFSQYMSKTGEYTFKVKAVPSKSSDSSDWSDESESTYIGTSDVTNGQIIGQANTTSTTATSAATTTANTSTSNTNSTTIISNVNIPALQAPSNPGTTGWRKEQSGWRYVYGGKYVQYSWLRDTDGKWYFIDENGIMKTGWYKDYDSHYYYLKPAAGGPMGSMATGLQYINNHFYYFSTTAGGPMGSMQTGLITVNGKQHYFDPVSGAMTN